VETKNEKKDESLVKTIEKAKRGLKYYEYRSSDKLETFKAINRKHPLKKIPEVKKLLL